jgi:hypothetical protein
MSFLIPNICHMLILAFIYLDPHYVSVLILDLNCLDPHYLSLLILYWSSLFVSGNPVLIFTSCLSCIDPHYLSLSTLDLNCLDPFYLSLLILFILSCLDTPSFHLPGWESIPWLLKRFTNWGSLLYCTHTLSSSLKLTMNMVLYLWFLQIQCNTSKTGGFFWFFFLCYYIQHCFICRPSDFTVSEDAGMEPRTVATSTLAVRRSNHYRLDLIHFSYRFSVILLLTRTRLFGIFSDDT